jgi:hypothetical protein
VSFGFVAAGNDVMSQIKNPDGAYERIWQSLHDKATEVLDAFGKKDYRGRADYWIVDDDWGLDFIRIEAQDLQLLRPVVVDRLKRILVDFPGWHIAVRVDVPGTEEAWPLMGILIFSDRVIDHLRRDYLPAEFRQITYEGI